MSVLSWFRGKAWRGRDREQNSVTFTDELRDFLISRQARSGVAVTTETALQVTAVLRCVMVIADSVATVPLKLMRSQGENRRPALDHPLYDVLAVEPNSWQSSLEYLEQKAMHAALAGNAYSFINRVQDEIVELIPIEPGFVTVKQESDYSLTYKVTSPVTKEFVEVPQQSMWHLRGPTWNGWKGMDILRLAREAIGLSIATENAHASRFRNGIQSSGVYSVDGTLNADQYKNLRDWIAEQHMGNDRAGNWFLLDRGAKWQAIDMSGVDAEHLETRKYQGEEACRALGVIPIMAGYSDKTATYASSEQMFLAHAVHTARPWHRRFERSISRHLLTREERRAGLYPKFFDAELLRGAAVDRGRFYREGISAGWLLRNEAREFEDMDPVEGLSEPTLPLNVGVGPNGGADAEA